MLSFEARREAVAKAMQAFAEPGTPKEAIQLPYKDGHGGPYTVIRVPVEAVLFNPRSHRIKSQLESHPQRQLVSSEPYSEIAQEIIHGILRETEGFEALKANLAQYGQRDPGVVTQDGLLVNANTRLAGLRELGFDYIRAAVLPSDADEQSIDRLELELQVQRDLRQDYTFTNELIFINELLSTHGYSEEKVAKALNWAASADEKELRKGTDRVRQSVRNYVTVRYIQEISSHAIPLTYFDDKRQALNDLDDKYESLKDLGAADADRVRNARIVGLLAGNFYRELRKIEDSDAVVTMWERLEDKEGLNDALPSLKDMATANDEANDEANDDVGQDSSDDDSSLLEGNGSQPGSTSQSESASADVDSALGALASVLAQSYGKDQITLPSGKTIDRDAVLRDVAESVDEAAEEVQATNKATRNITGPVRNLSAALTSAKASAIGYRQVSGAPNFDSGKFKYTLNKLRLQLAAIEKLVEQHDAG